MTIDMRLRPPLKSWKATAQFTEGTKYYPTRYGFPRPKSVQTQEVADLMAEMDEADVQWGVIMGRQSAPPHGIVPNDEIAECIAQHPDRFVSLAGIDLRDMDAALKEIDRTAKLPGFFGVSIEPGASFTPYYSDDPYLFPIYERARALKVPVSITLSGYLSSMAGHDTSYGSPSPVAKVARAFPDLKIIVSHAAWPNVMPMLEVAFLYDNVYVSPDLYMNHIDTPGAHEYLRAARFYLGERLLFGTAYPSRPLKESLEGFRKWGLERELEQKILHGNAARLLNIGS